jgi:ubiquinone/menaquinone biosynthesis C-methylase UbiE
VKGARRGAGVPADTTMKWFPLRKRESESLAVSMAGIKLGDRLLIVGCSDPLLIAQLATKTGLTGRAVAVDERDEVVANAAQIALGEGALVETSVSPFGTLPLETAAFDVAVVRDVLARLAAETRPAVLAEIRRVLRPGGRCLVIDSTPRGLAALVRSSTADVDHVSLLQAAEFKAARLLAERAGQVFAEAVNPIPNP